MPKPNKLAQINKVLETINEESIESATELETYLVKLEVNRRHRPIQITDILQGMSKVTSANDLILLEGYISALEIKVSGDQKDVALPWDHENPPAWSHQRFMDRQQRRQIRANRKIQNTY